MIRRWFLARLGSASAVVLATGPLTGCGGPTYAFRYRLTVEIDTPDGVKSGSSVIETRVFDDPSSSWVLPEARKIRTEVRGEAAFVELGSGRHVIALLASGPRGDADPDFARIAPIAFGLVHQEEMAKLGEIKGSRFIPERVMPTLVTFTDLTDPASARVLYATGTRSSVVNGKEVVTGEVVLDRFAETFGAGYAFKRATIEMTTDPISKAIEGKINWIGDYPKETTFERLLRGNAGGSSLMPGRNLKRN